MARTRVAVSDTDQDTPQALLAALADDPNLDVASVTLADARNADADVLVLGSRGDLQQAARLCAAVTSTRDDLPVVLLVDSDRSVEILTALAAGARGLVLRADRADTIRKAVHQVAQGPHYLDPDLAHVVVELAVGNLPDPTELTPAEMAILKLLVADMHRADRVTHNGFPAAKSNGQPVRRLRSVRDGGQRLP